MLKYYLHYGDLRWDYSERYTARQLGIGLANAIYIQDEDRVAVWGGLSQGRSIWWGTVLE